MVILVIEDDAEVRWATVRTLQEAGYRVLAGGTAAEAIELTHRHRPALVLLDVVLPDGDGVAVARQLKSDPVLAGVFVSLVSGVRTTSREQAEGLTKGLADGYIKRPFSKVELLARVEAFLRIRAAEHALRESEKRFKAIANYTVDWESWFGPGGEYLWVNPAVERVTGYAVEEILAMPDFSAIVIAPEDRERFAAHFGEAISGGRGDNLEFQFLHKDGSQRWLGASWQTIFDLEGRSLGVRASFRDITERKQAEARLAQAQKMESVGRLAGGIAHDFNNLLTVINGYSQLVLGKLNAGDPLRRPVAQIRQAGERAADLTRQLLAFSRKQVLAPRVLDLDRLVEEMAPMLGRLAGEDVEVRLALHAERGAVHADPHQLEQVLVNLVANGRDAMPRGGELLIETSLVERDVLLAVSDNGEGMNEATRQRIFEPFFTTKEVGQGTGLGLSMIQGIVAQSGGHIEVASELGRGTTFKIFLPALAEVVAERAEPARARPARLVVADDEAGVRSYLKTVLEDGGYEVIEAENGKQAFKEALAQRVDLVITDLGMPEQEGIETIQALRQEMPGVGIIAVSGAFNGEYLRSAQLLGADAVLTKPISADVLLAKTAEVLKLRR